MSGCLCNEHKRKSALTEHSHVENALKSSQEPSCLILEKKFNISKNFSASATGK
jgi:hypothetical protein